MGIAIGDGFGQRFFGLAGTVMDRIERRILPRRPWQYTDDTVMALSVVEVLERHAEIDQDALASAFLAKYAAEPHRGYGAGAHKLFGELATGSDWRTASRGLFGGNGSYGNGAAMRVAPIGAYFSDDLERVTVEAKKSAEVTHAHAEGQAGAIAVAIAAACSASSTDANALFDAVLDHTPPGPTRDTITRAQELPLEVSVHAAASLLGTGVLVASADTVPFVTWCAARHLGNFEEAMWATVAGLGDRDTTCAMVGGIVSLSADIPVHFVQGQEEFTRLVGLGIP